MRVSGARGGLISGFELFSLRVCGFRDNGAHPRVRPGIEFTRVRVSGMYAADWR